MDDHRNPDLAADPFIAELRRRYNALEAMVQTIHEGPDKESACWFLGASLAYAQAAALRGYSWTPPTVTVEPAEIPVPPPSAPAPPKSKAPKKTAKKKSARS